METEYIAMAELQAVLDYNLGFCWWKKYIAGAFWGNIATPINLSITLFTALTTVQATSSAFLPERAYLVLSVATMIISVINTFFKPHQQMTETIKAMTVFSQLGQEFEDIVHSPCATTEDIQRRTAAMRDLQARVNKARYDGVVESMNFFTDFLHIVMRNTILRGKDKWLDLEKGSITFDIQGAREAFRSITHTS